MPNDIELDDLVVAFPLSTDPNIQQIVSSKQEFLEKATISCENLTPDAKSRLFNHQEVTTRYAIQADDIILMYDTGMGKTCAVTAVAQYYKHNESYINRFYFIVNGDTQIEDIKRQIACVCTDGEYINLHAKTATKESIQKRDVTNEIKKWYEVTTYITFAKMIMREYPNTAEGNERLRNDFSGCGFFLDEFQLIRIKEELDAKKWRERTMVYATYWRLFHVIDRSKKILMSATPMVDSVSELAHHLNLILTLDQQIGSPFTETLQQLTGIMFTPKEYINFETVTIEQLEPYLRGKVSYIRSTITGVESIVRGDKIENFYYNINGVMEPSRLRLDTCVMSPAQANAYYSAMGGNVYNVAGISAGAAKPGGWSHGPRQACNWVYPDGSYGLGVNGQSGFSKFMSARGGRFVPNDQLRAALAIPVPDPNWPPSPYPRSLLEMSCKGYKIVKGAIEEYGKRYVYSHYVKGGALMIGAALEQYTCRVVIPPRRQGEEFAFRGNPDPEHFKRTPFTRFNARRSVFVSNVGGIRGYCEDKSKKDRFIDESICPPMPRYAVISQSTLDTERANIFELFNSENVDGHYIKVVIVSPVGQFGINLFNVLHVDIFTPEWTPSTLYQAKNRVFRIVAYLAILLMMKRAYALNGLNSDNIKVPVNIHFYAAFLYTGAPELADTLDTIMYKYSERKDFFIRRVLRMMKVVAIDCNLDKSCNVHSDDKAKSQDCDYQECNYQCWNQMYPQLDQYGNVVQQTVDTSTYDVFYKGEIIDRTSEEMKSYWRKYSYGTLEDFKREIPTVQKEKYFIMVMEEQMRNEAEIYDKFGIPCYIREDGGVFYLSRTMSRVNNNIRSDYLAGEYANVLVGIGRTTLSSIASDYEAQVSHEQINYIYQRATSADMDDLIADLSFEGRSRLLEDAILRHTLPSVYNLEEYDAKRLEYIMKMFKNSWLNFPEPKKQLQISASKIRDKLVGKGVESLKPTISMAGVDFTLDGNNEYVFVHNMYVIGTKRRKYGMVSKYYNVSGRVRLFKPSEGKWRDPNIYEQPVYSTIFSLHLKDLREEVKKVYPISAVVMEDGKFRVRDNRGGRKGDGRECGFFNKKELIDIMYYLQVPSDISTSASPEYKAQQIAVKLKLNPYSWKPYDMEFYTSRGIDPMAWWYNRIDYYYTFVGRVVKMNEMCADIALYMLDNMPDSVENKTSPHIDTREAILAYVDRLGISLVGEEEEKVSPIPTFSLENLTTNAAMYDLSTIMNVETGQMLSDTSTPASYSMPISSVFASTQSQSLPYQRDNVQLLLRRREERDRLANAEIQRRNAQNLLRSSYIAPQVQSIQSVISSPSPNYLSPSQPPPLPKGPPPPI